MVGIVGILLLGSLAWSAVGALFSALGEATATFSPARPTPTKLVLVVATPTQVLAATAQPTEVPISAMIPPTSTPEPTPQPTVAVTPTSAASGRAPWILLPQPAPGARVTPG